MQKYTLFYTKNIQIYNLGILFVLIMHMKKMTLIICFLCSTWLATAQEPLRQTIDSMNYKIRDFRDSVRQEIRLYKDSVREVRRHAYDSMPHEIRIGWGDQMFETLVWHEIKRPTMLPPTYIASYQEHFRYTQHWFAEYLYNVNYWYSFGAMIDYSGVLWDEVLRNGQDREIARKKNCVFHNVVIMPEVRFSYHHTQLLSLYSSFGVGININTGTEVDYRGRQTAVAPVINISLLGLRIGSNRWYGAIEVGGMFSFIDSNEVYMAGSRIFTASIGCRL